MKQDYTNDDTFLARWLEDKLTDEELSDFKKSEDFVLFQKIVLKSKKFQVPTFDEDKTLEQIKNKIQARKTKVKKLIPSWMYATAAAILVLVGLTYFLSNKNTSYNTNIGEQFACILPDGSQVKLNGNTTISFSKKQWENGIRTVDLKGEAYFKVKKGKKFSVITKNGTVSVLGTKFNVNTLPNFLGVECYEGKVNVKNPKFELLLTPGKGVQFLNNKKTTYNIITSEPNWLLNTYQYNGTPLKVVFKDLENYYKVKIKNKDVNLDKKYSGILIKDDLEKALKIICKSMDIQYNISNEQVIIFN